MKRCVLTCMAGPGAFACMPYHTDTGLTGCEVGVHHRLPRAADEEAEAQKKLDNLPKVTRLLRDTLNFLIGTFAPDISEKTSNCLDLKTVLFLVIRVAAT